MHNILVVYSFHSLPLELSSYSSSTSFHAIHQNLISLSNSDHSVESHEINSEFFSTHLDVLPQGCTWFKDTVAQTLHSDYALRESNIVAFLTIT